MKRLGPYPGCLQTELADPLFLIRSNLNKEVVMGNTLLAESERLLKGEAAGDALDFGDAWAAGSAWSAAWVAWAAAREAWGDGDAMKEKIIRYGLKLHVKGGL